MAQITALENGGYVVDGHEMSYETVVQLANMILENDMKQEIRTRIADKYGEESAEKVPDNLIEDIADNAMECFNEHFGVEAENAINNFRTEIKAELDGKEQEAG